MSDPLPPADDLPIPVAYLVSVMLESAFWGAYAVLFGISIWIIVYKRKTEQANKPMLYAVITLFIFSTAHIAIQWARICIAFFEQGDTPDGARLYLQSAGIPMSILSETVYGILSIMADSLLIYRAWIVWNRNMRVIIVPMIVLFVSAGVAVVATYELLRGGPHGTVLNPAVHTWSTTYFVLALATNIAVTMIIAYRIWSISRESADTLGQVRTRKYMSVIGIVIESGAIYVILMIPMVILFACNYFAKLIPFNILGQVMGMVPTLIIVRVGLGHSIDDQYGGQVSRTHHTSSNGGRITPATNSKILISVTRTQTGDEFQLGKYPTSSDQLDGADSSIESSFHRSKQSRDMSPV